MIGSIVDKAKEIATKAHQDQTRWDGRPYIIHPEKVVSILKMFEVTSEKTLAVGYLHDVLEDTTYTEEQMRFDFGNVITDAVKELTFQDSRKNDEIYYEQCSKLSEYTKIVKIADIIANLTDEGRKSQHFIEKRLKALKILVDCDTVDRNGSP